MFEQPRGERAHHHCAKKHRDVGTHDDAHCGDRADDSTTCPIDDLATGVADEYGKQISQGRTDELGEGCVGSPPRLDEEGR